MAQRLKFSTDPSLSVHLILKILSSTTERQPLYLKAFCLMLKSLNSNAVKIVRQHTWSCNGAGGKDRQQALSLQGQEMLLLHLKELLLDGNLLGCQLKQSDNTTSVRKFPSPFLMKNKACSGLSLRFDSGKKSLSKTN